MEAIAKTGRPAFYEKNAEAIIDRLVPMVQQNDVVAIFSNGGFDGHPREAARKIARLIDTAIRRDMPLHVLDVRQHVPPGAAKCPLDERAMND